MLTRIITLATLAASATTTLAVPHKPLLGRKDLGSEDGLRNLLKIRTRSKELEQGLVNLHASWDSEYLEEKVYEDGRRLTLTYGDCGSESSKDSHHVVGSIELGKLRKVDGGGKLDLPERFVWIIESETPSGGCLSGWLKKRGGGLEEEEEELVSRSEPLSISSNSSTKRKREEMSRRGYKMEDFDTNGLWFDGVEYLKQKQPEERFVSQSKSKKIAIVGAGASGLMTSLLLESVGIENYTILEASQRFGGRIHTSYLEGGPEDYQYQEMGPMRFPLEISVGNETVKIKDHDLVFQLAEKLNSINRGNSNLTVDFIDWVQTMPGDLRYKYGIKVDGKAPNLKQISKDPSLYPSDPNPQVVAAQSKVEDLTASDELRKSTAENVYQSHHDSVMKGIEDGSVFDFVHHLWGYDLNVTDVLTSGSPSTSFWDDIYENNYFTATSWKTIDKGLNRLPEAFWGTPAANKTVMGRKISRLVPLKEEEEGGQSGIRLFWKPNNTASSTEEISETYDYAIVSAPFSVVRYWRLPGYSDLLTRAIKNLQYSSACKVALQFKTRFWERFDDPILGGCSTSDIPGIGTTCYPSYRINSTGPGVMLSSYISGDAGNRLVSWSESQHVQYVLDAMVEMHGDVARQEYTGRYDRRCWALDEFQSGSWASPLVGQHKLYVPAYYRTEHNTIFVGEHTSFTHAWIASALESAIRGTVQLCLDLGLVDEAKMITREWMGRWLSV
ncbi:hypothetical protein IE53DRAFT_402029 [Violaceomyces palustris]|uniref:Uncharacterized protein n=1 Tax=Violaceomyces palustris TaxID=1673888 RepID=A0ACD0NP51_9BASI|nr:hypothetical protein IE53DRAFT_402029 [Violaceomyces palustris]